MRIIRKNENLILVLQPFVFGWKTKQDSLRDIQETYFVCYKWTFKKIAKNQFSYLRK